MNRELLFAIDKIIIRSRGFYNTHTDDGHQFIGPNKMMSKSEFASFCDNLEQIVNSYNSLFMISSNSLSFDSKLSFYKQAIDSDIIKFSLYLSQNNAYSGQFGLKTFAEFLEAKDLLVNKDYFRAIISSTIKMKMGAEFAIFANIYLGEDKLKEDPFFSELRLHFKKLIDNEYANNQFCGDIFYSDPFSSIFVPNLMGDLLVLNKKIFKSFGARMVSSGYHFVKDNQKEAISMCLSDSFTKENNHYAQQGIARGLILNGLLQDDIIKCFSKIRTKAFQSTIESSLREARLLYHNNREIIFSFIRHYKNEDVLMAILDFSDVEILPFFLKFKDSMNHITLMKHVYDRMNKNS